MESEVITSKYNLSPSGELKFPRDKAVLLIFYPGDFTPVCTRQLCEYRDNYSEFLKLNCDIIGVSKDSHENHMKMIAEHKIPFPLIADTKETLIAQLKMKVLGKIPKRGYALIDKNGYLKWKNSDLVPVFFTSHTELTKVLKGILSTIKY